MACIDGKAGKVVAGRLRSSSFQALGGIEAGNGQVPEFAGEGLSQEFVSPVGVVAIVVEEIFGMVGKISRQVHNADEVAVQLGGEFEEFGSNLVEEPALDIIEAAAAPGPIGTPTSFEEGPAAHLVERSEFFRR